MVQVTCMTEISVSVADENQTLYRSNSDGTSDIQPSLKTGHISSRNPCVGIHNQCNFCFTALPACPPPQFTAECNPLIGSLVSAESAGASPVVVVTIKLIISISLCILFPSCTLIRVCGRRQRFSMSGVCCGGSRAPEELNPCLAGTVAETSTPLRCIG